jgi:hypothetical protein
MRNTERRTSNVKPRTGTGTRTRNMEPGTRNLAFVFACSVIVSALVALGLATTAAQTAATARIAPPYTPPRTSWGDPDLQGIYTNSNEYATPLERPKEFAGRRLEDLTAEDLARVRQQATTQAIAGLANGEVRGPDEWWLQILDLAKRNHPWLIVDPPDGRVPPLTPEATERLKGLRARSSFAGGPFDGPEDLGMLERCISRSIPGSMIPVMYGNNYQIIQSPGYIVITYEIVHEARVIPLDGRAHIGRAIRAHMGDPRGRWDGNSLVVETTNFTGASAYRNANAETFRVIERFTRVAPDRIEWTATLDDPKTWTSPWTIAMPLTADPNPIFGFECHEHNYGLRNILSAARAAERNK